MEGGFASGSVGGDVASERAKGGDLAGIRGHDDGCFALGDIVLVDLRRSGLFRLMGGREDGKSDAHAVHSFQRAQIARCNVICDGQLRV